MELIGWYILFALTTTLVANYELIHPVMQQAHLLTDSNNNLVNYSFLTYIIFSVFIFMFAPLFILACIVPSWGERFRKQLLETILEGGKIQS